MIPQPHGLARSLRRKPSIGDYLSFLSRRRRTILAVTAAVTAVVTAVTFMTPLSYTANTSLFVKFGREFIYRPEVGTIGDSPAFNLGEIVNSEVELLRSRELARKVIDEIGVGVMYPDLAEEEDPARASGKAVDTFQSMVLATGVLESSIIKVSFDHPDPEIASRALNLLVDRFLEKHLEIYSEQKTNFIRAQLLRNEDELRKSEEELSSFKMKKSIVILPEQQRLLLARTSQLEADRFDGQLRILELREKIRSLQGDPAAPPEAIPGPTLAEQKEGLLAQRKDLLAQKQQADLKISDLEGRLSTGKDLARSPAATYPVLAGTDKFRFLDEALVRLLDLELKEKEILRDYRDDSREARGVRSGIRQIETFLVGKGGEAQAMMDEVIADEIAAWKARREVLEAEIGKLDALEIALTISDSTMELSLLESRRSTVSEELGRLRKEFEALNLGEMRLRELERDVAIDERSVQVLMERYQEAQITDELDRQKMVNVRVIERAETPLFATGLSRATRIFLGSFIALLAGVTIAFFQELFRP